MKAFLLFLLVPLAMALHLIFTTQLGWYEQWPVTSLVLMAVSILLLGRMLLRTRPLKKGILTWNVAAWTLTGFFLWWTQVYSNYPGMENETKIGENVSEKLPAEGLLDPEGNPFDLRSALGESSATLLVFYRGHW